MSKPAPPSPYLWGIAHVAKSSSPWSRIRRSRKSFTEHVALHAGSNATALRIGAQTFRHHVARFTAEARMHLREARAARDAEAAWRCRVQAAVSVEFAKSDRMAAQACELLLLSAGPDADTPKWRVDAGLRESLRRERAEMDPFGGVGR